MLPIRRTVASLLVNLVVYLVLKELSLKRRLLSRAPRVDAKLISSNPSLLDKRRSIILPTEVLVGSSLHWMAILSSPLLGVENNTSCYLYYDIFTIKSMSICTQYECSSTLPCIHASSIHSENDICSP